MDSNSEKLLKSASRSEHSPQESHLALLGAEPRLYPVKNLVRDQVPWVCCPRPRQPAEEEHPPLTVPAVQAPGDGHGGLPPGIFLIDGGPMVEQVGYTVQTAHGCSHVQGCPAHGGSAETVGSCKKDSWLREAHPPGQEPHLQNHIPEEKLGRGEALKRMLGKIKNCPWPQHGVEGRRHRCCTVPAPSTALPLVCPQHAPAQTPFLASTTLGGHFRGR